ncbi:MAG: hypothetical protein QOJ71_1873 [Actinomycetota bacterium]|nr:hypothetical protein [Actinomycetota bacterium]
MLMTERGDEGAIVALLASAVPSIARCRLVGISESESGWQPHGPALVAISELASQIAGLDTSGGPMKVGTSAWGYALPLRSFGGIFGYAVVVAEEEPSSTDQLLLRLLAQQTGIALANARLHELERTATAELRSTNVALAETLGALELSTVIHARLTDVAAAGGDQSTIARAVHDLTSYPVAIEDRHGNLRAWAGPDRPPEPYPKAPPRVRSAMLRRAVKAGRPIREGDHLLVVASPQDDLLGVLALVDPSGTAGEREWTALEHGATVLAVELARLRAVAETELRMGRDLVDELLSSAEEERTLARAQGLGYDLLRPHRVVVVAIEDDRETDGFVHGVRRAALDLGVGSLLVARANSVVVISEADGDWDRMRHEIDRALGGGRCRIGVGGRCTRPSDFPRSYREARLALKVQTAAGNGTRSTEFDALGVIRILAESEELSGIERFVDLWLGALREYDEAHGAALLETLSQYLEQGGNYEATAHALSTHRNTVKYRLQRIRAISGLDLADADTRFNLQLATRALQTMNALSS